MNHLPLVGEGSDSPKRLPSSAAGTLGNRQRQLAFLWKARWLIPYPMFTLRTQESQRETTNAFP